MVIIPICIFTIAYRKGYGLGGWGEEEKQAMDMLSCAFRLTIVKSCGCVCSERLGIGLRAVFHSGFSRVYATLSNGHGGTVVVRQRLILDCTYFCEKVPSYYCETNSIRITFSTYVTDVTVIFFLVC